MNIDIIDQNKYFSKNDIKYFQTVITKSLKYLDLDKNTEICLTFISDNKMRSLNKDFRDIDKSTDVLSFPQKGPASNILGDIIISYETAKRHSIKYKKKLNDEVIHLIIHGLLHLLGYDHKKKKDGVIMRQKEEELLNKIKTQY